MITFIHGDDTVSSRKFFVNLRQQKKDSNYFSGDSLKLTDLVQVIEGNALFTTNKTLFIEDFFPKKKAGKEFEELVNYLNKHSDSTELYLWESKTLTKKQTSLFSKPVEKLFKLPQAVFSLLDSLKPDDGERLVILFHQALKNAEAEFIYYMLIRQFRLLLALASDLRGREAVDLVGRSIDEVLRLAPWQKQKLQRQAHLFPLEKLTATYNKLYAIDLGQKTGSLHLSLTQSIDFFLLDL